MAHRYALRKRPREAPPLELAPRTRLPPTIAVPVLEVPLFVQLVAGNPVTSAAVLLCLNTIDATVLRRAHPALLRTVADVPWCDTAAAIHDVRRWRGALPSAVGARVAPQLRSLNNPALLAGLTWLDARQCGAITNAVVKRLPSTLRHLVVQKCRSLTLDASFTHLPLLTSLDCSYTAALEDGGLWCLPPSLQELRIDYGRICKQSLRPSDFLRLPALRVLSWKSGQVGNVDLSTPPPSLEELDVTDNRAAARALPLTHLPRLRIVRAGGTSVTDATVAALPACVEELVVWGCHELTPGVSFAHLTALRTLNAADSSIGDASLASLPPSLVSLDVSYCKWLSPAATLPSLPALQVLGVRNTRIGNAFVASLPPSLLTLRIADCAKVTPAAHIRHLVALRELQSAGTAGLARSAVATLRVRASRRQSRRC